MDYKDFIAGQTEQNFWFRGKKNLINVLMSKVKGKTLKILDIGAGTGIDLKILNKYGDVYVIDINQKALDLIPENLYIEKKLCDVRNLSYPDEYFDVVCSFDVFEHVEEDFKAVSEVRRVLKKGGYLVFTVPAFQFIFSSHDKALNHFRRYSEITILNLLRNFKKIKISYWNSLLFLPVSLMRIMKKRSEPKLDFFNLPNLLEKIFVRLLKIENRLINSGFKLPFGLSLVGYCIK